jgi:exopolyphosphatase / guanosine-5'-triphosphate,3'-diphosphate pyrophosphatase
MGERPGGAVAAIDCGTNSTRLLVVDGEGRTLSRLMRITRLGQGVDASHKLSVDAIDRTVRVLGEFRGEMDRFGVARVRMVATSAVRDAVNGQEFLDAASETVGAPAELLSGEEEGRLAYAGATSGLPASTGDDVVIDIGGGSTELIAARAGILGVVSLDLGCVRLTERYLASDPPTVDELSAAVATIDAELDRAQALVPVLRSLAPGSRLIGLAGTVSTLAALDQGLVDYDRSQLHHSVLTAERVAGWCTVLAGEPAAARARRAGMVPGREDVIVGGALVLRQAMARIGIGECLVSESDILDGLVAGHRPG